MMKKICSVMLLCATILMASCQKDDEATIGVSEVKLDKTELSLVLDESGTLLATVLPDDAEDATVAWSSSDKTVATVSEVGVVLAIKVGETTITATAGGKTATCKVTVEDKPNYVEVNGIKVATGNLVANGANSCKIGAPTDGGLYFQFGSLVGWAGGANGDGTGVPASNAPGYAFNATGIVVPSGKNFPSTWDDLDRWEGTTGTVPALNDPCTHYLGSGWRLPTTDEYKTLFNNTNSAWLNSGGWSFNGNSKSATHTSGLTFPASGYRLSSDGSLNYVGTYGYYWSASPNNASSGYRLYFGSSYVYPSTSFSRASGLPVRCVQNASN